VPLTRRQPENAGPVCTSADDVSGQQTPFSNHVQTTQQLVFAQCAQQAAAEGTCLLALATGCLV
jgi:hypothetical protein